MTKRDGVEWVPLDEVLLPRFPHLIEMRKQSHQRRLEDYEERIRRGLSRRLICGHLADAAPGMTGVPLSQFEVDVALLLRVAERSDVLSDQESEAVHRIAGFMSP